MKEKESELVSIRTCIVGGKTQIWKVRTDDSVEVKTVITDRSQIRPERESFLYKTTKEFKPQRRNQNVAMYQKLGIEIEE